MQFLHTAAQVIGIGIGATAVMDLWLVLLSRLGVPTTSFALVGRWVGHLALGTCTHTAIAKSAPVRHELTLGWAVHYFIGIAYAAILVWAADTRWLTQPTLAPALALGVFSVGAPWFVMQPSMGAGVLASKTPAPLMNCLRNLGNHTVFGLGLYLAAHAWSAAGPQLTH